MPAHACYHVLWITEETPGTGLHHPHPPHPPLPPCLRHFSNDTCLSVPVVVENDRDLHSKEGEGIRCEGIRLFLLWLQALRDNCAEEQLLVFACLVPGFPAVPSTRGPCTLDTIIYNPFSSPPDGQTPPPCSAHLLTPATTGQMGDVFNQKVQAYILNNWHI
ncbi:hypothetical protein CRUP_004537 [Coryphaenoides rupestris]|nr:hypothetical protein CRUP_004537 [Coryphaenoides rupestris]